MAQVVDFAGGGSGWLRYGGGNGPFELTRDSDLRAGIADAFTRYLGSYR